MSFNPGNWIAALSIGLLALATSHAKAQDAEDVSEVSLIAETTRVYPGQTILLGLRFELKDKWHIYWHGRNDTGFAPIANWALPEGVTVGPMLWPAPQRYESPGNILDHVYEGQPTILVPLTVAAGARPGTSLNISGEIEWLVCRDICLPGFGPVSLNLEVVPPPQQDAGADDPLSSSGDIGRAAARLPEPVTAGDAPEGLRLQWSDRVVTVQYPGASSLAFYPAMASTSLVSAFEDATADGDSLSLRLASRERDLSDEAERRLVGVLEATMQGDESRWYLINFGADGFRTPEQTELISRVRERVGNRSQRGG
ncbi:MAG: protein-disulfide reductase DsbD domain-containing protein [Phycisphaerales bacterium JB060]